MSLFRLLIAANSRRPKMAAGHAAMFLPTASAAVLVAVFAPFALAQKPSVTARAQPLELYQGESLSLQVEVSNVGDQPLKLPEMPGFRIVERGSKTFSQESYSFFNGQRRAVIKRGTVYGYLLTPQNAGALTIPAIVMEHEGESYSSEPIEILVRPAPKQDRVKLSIEVHPDAIYPMQPFDVRVNVSIKGLPEPLKDRNPLTYAKEPTLTFAWAVDDSLPAELQPKEKWDRWLGRRRSENVGFQINNIRESGGLGGGFGGFGGFGGLSLRSRPILFMPEPEETLEPDGGGRLTNYWKFTFDRRFTANKPGSIEVPSARLKGQFPARLRDSRRLEMEDVYVFAPNLTLTIKDAPTEGRPPSFTGGLGDFQFSAEISPKQARVGDPMMLRISVHGEGTLDRIIAPKLADMPEVARRFRIYDATSETLDGERRFEYRLRPLNDQVDQFPPIEIAYFDVHREEFVTGGTSAIPLEITPAEGLSDGQISMSAAPQRRATSVERSEGGIFANDTNTAALRDESVDPARWFAGLGVLAGLYILSVIGVGHYRKVGGDAARKRRKGALARAEKQLREAGELRRHGRLREAADGIQAALIGLVADTADLEEASLATGDVRTAMADQLTLPEPLIDRTVALLETCDGARYGGTADNLGAVGADALALVKEMVAAFRARKKV